MWYMLIRGILSFCLTIAVILILKKTQIRKHVIFRFVPVVVAILSFYIFSFCSIENIFINFDSPEKAFHYLYSGDVRGIANGDASSFVVYEKNGTQGQTIIPKNKNGWKLDVFQKNESMLTKTVNRYIISIYNARNTDDYYVMVWAPISDIADISDSNGSVFMCVENDNGSRIHDSTLCFAYVKSLDENYSLNIDGDSILFMQKQQNNTTEKR